MGLADLLYQLDMEDKEKKGINDSKASDLSN